MAVVVKIGSRFGIPGTWNQRLYPLVPWWFNLDPYPYDPFVYLGLLGMVINGLWGFRAFVKILAERTITMTHTEPDLYHGTYLNRPTLLKVTLMGSIVDWVGAMFFVPSVANARACGQARRMTEDRRTLPLGVHRTRDIP